MSEDFDALLFQTAYSTPNTIILLAKERSKTLKKGLNREKGYCDNTLQKITKVSKRDLPFKDKSPIRIAFSTSRVCSGHVLIPTD